jgi:osmotically-inducible protein OsmY
MKWIILSGALGGRRIPTMCSPGKEHPVFSRFEKADAQIQNDVSEELRWHSKMDATDIGVSVSKGVVTLRGSVRHVFEKRLALTAALRVSGVRAAIDELDLDLRGAHALSDEDITRAVSTELTKNCFAPKNVKITVQRAWVTLNGEIGWDDQKTAISKAVYLVSGVRGVSNEMQIKNTVPPSDIKTIVEAAIRQSIENADTHISVKVYYNRVTLSGRVRSISEIQRASAATWSCPGVVGVENNLMLGIQD